MFKESKFPFVILINNALLIRFSIRLFQTNECFIILKVILKLIQP